MNANVLPHGARRAVQMRQQLQDALARRRRAVGPSVAASAAMGVDHGGSPGAGETQHLSTTRLDPDADVRPRLRRAFFLS